jgi:hypothetical protein
VLAVAWTEAKTSWGFIIANNGVVFATAVCRPKRQLVAALVASPTKELLTAIRATLANNNSKGWITVKGGEHNAFLKGAKRGFIHVSASLAKANAAGVACALLHPLTGNPQEEAAEFFNVVVTPSERLSRKFGERLALSISWPTQAEWSEYLLTAGQEAGLVQLLPAAGPDFTRRRAGRQRRYCLAGGHRSRSQGRSN